MKTVVVLTILLVGVFAVVLSEEHPEQLLAVKLIANSSDLASEGQHYRYYRVQSVKLTPNKKPAKKPSGYSGYQSGYGAFRGRRFAINDESVFSTD
ncbi:hypothetical protein GHT06_009148 [Daphnia sinensis]|uniref:Uncharacterized protein n=1 Tax=Daphnia sinensis TaxID=1820382 RepID=A0AAD5L2J8_9CRUS|nr:hypothetical protein GHT06_009148 [Daphnia sinensis]